ncbi:MAG: alcohol dehydrogenase catalytic domain-containing protein [Rhodospirillales bacterium]|nr:alcohol dehydrogenase catalytic domain-containing protein [Rhodospirillales bacterium]MDE2198088.1 alcohol dehydrogenase catalytic domain-containing protein [Rhodospirillales bacterium]MDE2573909.1 alcohol dehydrogenase catalytic domain-containing protein [Rhodospirillales bacterium]
MRKAEFLGERRIAVAEAAQSAPAEGELRVRVRRCALCGSDLRLFRDGASWTPGHEILGTVEAEGDPLHGARVLVYIPVFCGTCAACKAGQTHLCEADPPLIGWNRPGGYAETLDVPRRCLLPVPDDVPDALAALLLDTIGTTAHAIRLAGRVIAPAGPVLVLGAGPIGLGAILVAQAMGFGPIHVSEPQPYRMDAACRLGATPWSPGEGRFPLVLESSGAAAARQAGIEAVAPHGVCVLLGESSTPWPLQENRAIRRKDFWMLRSFYFPIGDYAGNLALLRANQDAFATLVDRECGLDELEATFADFAAGRLLKPMLAPSAGR